MLKKILFHALIGGVIFVLGGCLHDFANIKLLGNILAYGGAAYAAIITILILFGVNFPSHQAITSLAGKMNDKRAAQSAREELLEYKKLLDAGILTREEFDSKASALKKLIL